MTSLGANYPSGRGLGVSPRQVLLFVVALTVMLSGVSLFAPQVAAHNSGECQSSILCSRPTGRVDYSPCDSDGCHTHLVRRKYVEYLVYACSNGEHCYTEWRRRGCVRCGAMRMDQDSPTVPEEPVLVQWGVPEPMLAQSRPPTYNLLASPMLVSSPESVLCRVQF